MLDKSSGISSLVPAVVFSLLIGGIGGFYLRYFYEPASQGAAASPQPAGMPAMMGGGGPGGMGGGRGMGGMGGGPPSGTFALPRLVRNLSIIEKVQNKGLTPQQAQAILPILEEIQSAEKLSAEECDAKIARIEKVLAEPQKQALQSLQPQRGGGGGGMMGGRQDPDRPFASERNRRALEDLISLLNGRGGT